MYDISITGLIASLSALLFGGSAVADINSDAVTHTMADARAELSAVDMCVDPSLTVESDETVYFVGCGGFF